jgi:hypothetical protein
MKISQLPQEVKEKALRYQKNADEEHWEKTTDYLGDAFDWEATEEEYDYWEKWYHKEFKEAKL